MVDTSNRKRFYLIDGHAQMFRAYHAIRSLSSPVTGEPTNATFGFVSMLLKLLREEKPDYLAMAIDIGGDQGTFRTQLDPQYKAQRQAPPEDFHPQVERIVEIVGMLNIPVLSAVTFEADDVIATICDRVNKLPGSGTSLPGAGVEVRIVSRDKDLKQLLGEQVTMFDPFKNELIDPRKLKEEEGIEPGQVVDVLALMGDNVDNIPGAPGIGPKTACKLIGQYGSLDNLLAHLDELSARQRENVEKAKDRYALNRRLVELRRDVPVDFELEQARVRLPSVGRMEPLFRQLGFTRHLRELEELSPPPEGKAKKQAVRKSGGNFSESLFGGMEEEREAVEPESAKPQAAEGAAESALEHAKDSDYLAIVTEEQLAELADFLRTLDWVSVDTETTDVNPMRAKLCGISLAWRGDQGIAKPQATELAGKRGVYVPVRGPAGETHLSEEQVIAALRLILEDEKIAKIGQNIKYDMIVLRGAGITLRGVMSDTMVASYLIDASRSSHSLDNLAMAFAGHRMIAISELIGMGKKQATFDTVPLAKATTYAAEDADVTLRLHELFMPKLKVMGLVDLFRGLEMPLVEVLAELEYNGIAVDAAELDRQRVGLEHRIGELHGEILELAKRDFNPDSPKQLADVLFNELGCKSYRKTKTGPSTDSEVLQRIVDEQAGDGAAVAERVLEYRQLTKLVGTYLGALKDAIDADGRIHASFNQTVAATGRLSSSDPNLQNIPIRTDLGRQIRKAFVAPPGPPESVLLSADYSQIELRLLAHLSQDPALIEAFENDQDIHRAVAAEVFGVPLDQVTGEQRSAAKMVNFGIVYGITPYGLARRLSPGAGSEEIERAKQIITDYKNRYPKIDRFLARCVEEAETKGYVETIMKRRRPIPQISSRHYNVKSLGERMAINTVVQGSAADLIKLAMVKLHRRIIDERLPMKMLLQIHDELVFETPADKAEQMAAIVRSEMTDAMKLSVPLKVDVHWAGNWFEAK
ncbi:MAG: DNA polymerase I [Phycisphaeraceae bacterium]